MPKAIRTLLKVILGVVIACAAAFAAYAIYLEVGYYRIPDGQEISNEGTQSAADSTDPAADSATNTLQAGQTYTALTYNIGFGAYTPDYTFFMDTGVMADGTPTRGTSGKAASKESVVTCTEGDINVVTTAASGTSPDFVLLQEVDDDSDRSYHVNQRQMLEEALTEDAAYFASNFHSGFLAYPIPDFHGSVSAGLLTLSDVTATNVTRRSYPIDESWPTKFFDLDRCFVVLRYPVSDGHELVLINSHMSAYDEGGTVREQQLALLTEVLSEERAKGNYVIAGGDWNHALCGSVDLYPSEQQVPSWVAVLDESDLPEGFSVVRPINLEQVASCHGDDIPYEKGVTYTVTVDGFIVSDNVTATDETLDLGFEYSDHNPVLLSFSLMEE